MKKLSTLIIAIAFGILIPSVVDAQFFPIPVRQGGTGASSFSAGDCLVGNGTAAITTLPCGSGGGGGSGGAFIYNILKNLNYPATTTSDFLLGATSTTSPAKLNILNGTYGLYVQNNVGIGTTSPYAKLSVVGEIVARNFTATSTQATSTFPNASIDYLEVGTLVKGPDQYGFNSMLIGVDNTGIVTSTSTPTAARYLATSTSLSSIFPLADITKLSNLTSNGLIKTSGSDGTLSIAANGTDYTLLTTTTCGAGSHISAVTASGSVTCSNDSGGGGGGSGIGWSWNGVNLLYQSTSTDDVLLGNNATTSRAKLEVRTTGSNPAAYFDGNVGIGTTTPSVRLEVGSTTAGQVAQAITNASASGSAYAELQVRNDYKSDDALRLMVLGNNYTTSGALMQDSAVINADTNLIGGISILTKNTFAPIRFYTAGQTNERMRIAADGNVGIGTTSPFAKLSVVGPVVAEYFNATSTTATSTFSGSIRVNTGGEGNPSIAFGTEVNTGFHLQSAGVIDVNIPNQFRVDINNSSTIYDFQSTQLLPAPNATNKLGSFGYAWNGVYASSTSYFNYASTTAISGTNLCIGTDCRILWPTSGGGGGDFAWTPTTYGSTAANSTSTLIKFNSGIVLTASSTIQGTTTISAGYSISTQENIIATSSNTTIDWGKGNYQTVRIGSAAVTLTFSNPVSLGQPMTLEVCNPNSTSGAITWAGGLFSWPGGIQPGQTTIANQCDIWTFRYSSGTSTAKYKLTGLISGYQ